MNIMNGGNPVSTINTDWQGLVQVDAASGYDAVRFTYTIADGDSSAEGELDGTTPFTLNGGTIADAAGNSIDLTSFATATDISSNESTPVVFLSLQIQ